MWNKIKEFIVYNLDTIKIVLTILASVFGVITGCDLKNNWNLQNHPFFDFVKWVLCSNPLLIFLIISVLLIVIAIIEKCKGGSYANLKKELIKNRRKLELLDDNLKEILVGQLIAFGRNELGFGNENLNKERLTLYWVDPEEKETKWLYQLARFSSNPIYDKSKSKRYSIEKGCIGQAYKHDWCFDSSVTDGSSKSKYNYTDEELSLINMKSHTYAACKIIDNDNNIYGVLVAEHLERNAWVEEDIKSKLQLQAMRLSKMLKILNVYIKNRYKDNNKGGTQW